MDERAVSVGEFTNLEEECMFWSRECDAQHERALAAEADRDLWVLAAAMERGKLLQLQTRLDVAERILRDVSESRPGFLSSRVRFRARDWVWGSKGE